MLTIKYKRSDSIPPTKSLPIATRCPFRSGLVLTLHCELVEQRGPVGIGKASAYVDGKCAATAELTFVLT